MTNALVKQFAPNAFITLLVFLKLRNPKFGALVRILGQTAAVTMPKTAMHKDGSPLFHE
jgi:hypothetical protein